MDEHLPLTDPNRFYNQDNVTFGNVTNLTVNISSATVLPASVNFTNDASHNYVINSSGGFGIGEAGSLDQLKPKWTWLGNAEHGQHLRWSDHSQFRAVDYWFDGLHRGIRADHRSGSIYACE